MVEQVKDWRALRRLADTPHAGTRSCVAVCQTRKERGGDEGSTGPKPFRNGPTREKAERITTLRPNSWVNWHLPFHTSVQATTDVPNMGRIRCEEYRSIRPPSVSPADRFSVEAGMPWQGFGDGSEPSGASRPSVLVRMPCSRGLLMDGLSGVG